MQVGTLVCQFRDPPTLPVAAIGFHQLAEHDRFDPQDPRDDLCCFTGAPQRRGPYRHDPDVPQAAGERVGLGDPGTAARRIAPPEDPPLGILRRLAVSGQPQGHRQDASRDA